MTQPTLATIPGILLRTVLRMIGRIIFVGAAAFLIIGTALTLLSLLVATWHTPRSRRVQLASNILLLTVELIKDRRRVTQTDSH